MDNSNFSTNWFRLPEHVEELSIIEEIGDEEQCKQAALLRERISLCRDLKARLEQD